MDKQRVLFLCTHNSARSQMAEALLRKRAGDRFEVASAGTEATRIHQLAVRAMEEVGIDLSGHTSKTVDRFLGEQWDYVITVCDDAKEKCPIFPQRTRRLHWSHPDPSRATGNEEERLATFRWVRDSLRDQIEQWITDQSQPRSTSQRTVGLIIATTGLAASGLAWRAFSGATGALVVFLSWATAAAIWTAWQS